MILPATATAGRQLMSAEAKKGYGSTLVLLMLGVLAFYVGSAWLLVLVPAAALVWRAAGESARKSGN
jgi:hypothetical protein